LNFKSDIILIADRNKIFKNRGKILKNATLKIFILMKSDATNDSNLFKFLITFFGN